MIGQQAPKEPMTYAYLTRYVRFEAEIWPSREELVLEAFNLLKRLGWVLEAEIQD